MTGMQELAAPVGFVDYPVLFDAPRAAAKLAAARRNRTSRIISLGISAALSAGIVLFFRDSLGDFAWPLIGVSVALPVVSLVLALVKVSVTQSEVEPALAGGLAVGIARGGLLLPGGWLPWSGVAAIRTAHRSLGRSPELLIEPVGGRVVHVALEHVSALPAALDTAVRALSGGRARVDFAGLDA